MVNTLLLISRMTLSYDFLEDRISMISEFDVDTTMSLDLTRRFLNKLVPHLLNFERESLQRPHGGDEAMEPFDENSTVEEEGRGPVALGPSSERFLVASVDVTAKSDQVILDWKGSEDKTLARLILSQTAATKWLRAIRHCFRQADWSQEAWGGVTSTPALEKRKASQITIH